MKSKKKTILSLLLVVIMFVGMFQWQSTESNAMTVMSEEEFEELLGTYSIGDAVPLYKEYLTQVESNRPDKTIEINAADYCRYEEDGKTAEPEVYDNYEGMEGASVLTSEVALVEYEVEVAESGLYDLSLVYYPIDGKNSEIQRAFFIDGELPYREMAIINFARVWKVDVEGEHEDESGIAVRNWESDNQGNHLKPTMVEAPEWVTTHLYDSDGYVTDKLAVYLEKGTHTITIKSEKEPMLLRKLVLSNEEETKSYEEV